MDNVKDVYWDDPQRYQAFPSLTLTLGPDAEVILKNYLPSELPEYQSYLDLLCNQEISFVVLNLFPR